jgi:glutaminase
VQSCSMPVTYAMALEEHGVDTVHQHVGREASGRQFNDICLKTVGEADRVVPTRVAIPHNPMISSGSLGCAALIRQDLSSASRLQHYLNTWYKLTGKTPYCSAPVMMSEREHADRVKALGFMMRECGAFKDDEIDLPNLLEFYFSTCATTVNTEMLASAAATYASGGVHPLSQERVFKEETTRHVLSLMLSCGMNSASGEWSFDVGIPAKSGMSGNIFLVIPNICGIAIWSPRVDEYANSVRGAKFARKFAEKYVCHHLDSHSRSMKVDLTLPRAHAKRSANICELLTVAASGDIRTLQLLVMREIDLNASDYDSRTALHVAAAEGRLEVVRCLVQNGADPFAKDRWGTTPLEGLETSWRSNHDGGSADELDEIKSILTEAQLAVDGTSSE